MTDAARIPLFCLLLCGCALLAPVALRGAEGAQWPHFAGPDRDFRAAGLPQSGRKLVLRTLWRQRIGSGYSQVVVADSHLYAMFSDGTDDVITALDRVTGEELWRYRIAATWRGHLGSEDGPISTPAIAGEQAVGLGPRGHLFALDRRSGVRKWQIDLPAVHGAVRPLYGFATSPLIHHDRVVVQIGGGAGRSVAAFDAETGKLLWTSGSEPVGYQSPTLLTLLAERQLISVNETHLRALVPESGEALWEHRYLAQGDGGGPLPIPSGDGRFLLNTQAGAIHYQLTRGNQGYRLRELWSSDQVKFTYAIPVYRDGYFYGYSGSFLTSLAAASGERVWRSRSPGRGSLLLLGDLLVVWDVKGRLTVIEASPEGYRELASAQILDLGSVTNPSFADGKIFVRNLSDVATVEILASDPGPRVEETVAEVSEPAGKSWFAALLRQLAETPDKTRLVDEFFAGRSQFPIIKGGGNEVHFIYRGEARDVGVYLGYVFRGDSDPMQRVTGTDLWYRTYTLDPGARYDYSFLVNYDELIADPLNPRRAPSPPPTHEALVLQLRNFRTNGEVSEVVMPGWREPDYLAAPDSARRGGIEELDFESEVLGNRRRLAVYLPHGYEGGGERYPLVIVTGGEDARELGLMPRILDNLIGRRVAPAVVAFVSYPPGRLFVETWGWFRDAYGRMVVDELLPFLAAKYRLREERESRVIMGADWAAYGSLHTALTYPEVFAKVATQSLFVHNQPVAETLSALMEKAAAPSLRIYMDWCKVDIEYPVEGTDLGRDNAILAALLQEKGHDVTARELASGRGWGTWRVETGRILETLLPVSHK